MNTGTDIEDTPHTLTCTCGHDRDSHAQHGTGLCSVVTGPGRYALEYCGCPAYRQAHAPT